MDGTPETSEPVTPEVLERAALSPDGSEAPVGDADGEQVTKPTKLIRIASMVRQMLDEVRRAPLDDAGRRRLREIHEKSVHELETVLSPELQKELEEVVLPFTSDAPSESELRLAQAQLVGWLEGLFHGIQATLFTQQAMAQGQLEQVRRRALEGGMPGAPDEGAGPGGPSGPPSGYL
jgi:Bacterial proteasome activator